MKQVGGKNLGQSCLALARSLHLAMLSDDWKTLPSLTATSSYPALSRTNEGTRTAPIKNLKLILKC